MSRVTAGKPRQARHVIAEIHHRKGVPDWKTPMACSCGWAGVAGDWKAHKAEVGETVPFVGHLRATGR